MTDWHSRYEYLNLSVVTDGFDGDGGFEWTVRVPWLQLNDRLRSPHQAGYCALVLQKRFFLFLTNTTDFKSKRLVLSTPSGVCTKKFHQKSVPSHQS
jgi:hypothetical protein